MPTAAASLAPTHPNGSKTGSPRTLGLFAFPPPRLLIFLFAATSAPTSAGVAQLVEQLICNHQVGGSSPFTGSTITLIITASDAKRRTVRTAVLLRVGPNVGLDSVGGDPIGPGHGIDNPENGWLAKLTISFSPSSFV